MTDELKHRDIATDRLAAAEAFIGGLGNAYDAERDIALAQAHALIAIGHALVDLAKDVTEVFPAS
jgi:hypothetical protein